MEVGREESGTKLEMFEWVPQGIMMMAQIWLCWYLGGVKGKRGGIKFHQSHQKWQRGKE